MSMRKCCIETFNNERLQGRIMDSSIRFTPLRCSVYLYLLATTFLAELEIEHWVRSTLHRTSSKPRKLARRTDPLKRVNEDCRISR